MPAFSKVPLTAALCLAVATLAGPVRAADLDKLVPADAEAALYLNIRGLADSVVFRRYYEKEFRAFLIRDAQLAAFLKSAEFDPFKDLSSITATWAGGGNNPRGCVVVRGNFLRLQVVAFLAALPRDRGLKILREGDQNYMTLPLQGQEIIARFGGIDALVVANDKDYLKAVVAGKKVEPTEGAKALVRTVGKLAGTETVFLAIALTQEMKDQLGNIPNAPWLKDISPKLEAFTAALHLTEALDLSVSVHTTDQTTAKQIVQLAKGFLPWVKQAVAGNEQLKPVVDIVVENVKIAADGTIASARLQLSAAQVKMVHESLGFPVERTLEEHLTDGQAALRAERWTAAEYEFREALKHDPKNAVAADGLEKAAVEIRKATLVHLTAGQAALKAERRADAGVAFNEVLRLDSKNVEAAAGLRKVAQEKLKTAVAPHLTAGQAALTAERWRDAAREFTEVLRLDPTNADADKGLQAAAAGTRRAVQAHLTTGTAALAVEDWARAAAAFQEALNVDPRNTAAAEGLQKVTAGMRDVTLRRLAAGREASQAGQWARAEAAFAEVLRLDPRNAEAAAGVRTAQIRQKKPDVLIAELASRDRDVRRRAAEILAEMGPEAKAAVPALLPLLEDPSRELRAAAATTLRKIDPATGPKVAAALMKVLTRDLASPDRDERRWAADELGQLGPAATAAGPALMTALHDAAPTVCAAAVAALKKIDPERLVRALTIDLASPDRDERRWAADELAGLGVPASAAVPTLLEALEDPAAEVQVAAAAALKALDTGKAPARALPQLVRALKSPQGDVRRCAADTLARMGPDATAAVPALLGQLTDTSREVRASAAAALRTIAPTTGPKVAQSLTTALIVELASRDREARRWAADELGKLGPDANAAVTALVAALDDAAAEVRLAAAQAVKKIDGDRWVALALPRLTAALESPDRDVRQRAAETVAGLGPEARTVVPRLLTALGKALRSPERDERTWAVSRLAGLGADGKAVLLDELPRALKSADRDTPRWAANELARLGADAKSAVPALLEASLDPSAELQGAAIAALRAVAPDDTLEQLGADRLANVLPRLVEALQARDADQRRLAADTLGRIGPRAKAAAGTALLEAMLDETKPVQFAAAAALKQIDPDAPVLARLTRALKVGDLDVRRRAAEGLQRLGPDAKPAIAALQDVLESPDRGLRHAAVAALKSIDAEAGAQARVRALIADLKSLDRDEVRAAAEALPQLGERAKAAVPALLAALDDDDEAVRTAVAVAVQQIDPKQAARVADALQPTVKALIRMLDPKQTSIREMRRQAAEELGKLGPAARAAISALEEAAKFDVGPEVRAAAAAALEKIRR